MGFGMIIKKIRSQLKMTQEQFARELDISFSTINRWENGHTVPSKLAKVRLLEFYKFNFWTREALVVQSYKKQMQTWKE